MLNTTKPAFTWDEFENGKIAVKCEKKPLAKLFLGMCDEREYEWGGGDKATNIKEIRSDEYPIWITHNYCGNGLSYTSWGLSDATEVNFTDILTIRESEPVPESPEFSWKKFKTEKIAVNCKTEESEINRFLGLCENTKTSYITWKVSDGSTVFTYGTSGANLGAVAEGFHRRNGYTIIDSTTIPDLKFRPFRELKTDLILRTVRNKICLIVDFIARYRPENKTVEINGMRVNASELFEYYEFLDPKTGETSPCGEVDCE